VLPPSLSQSRFLPLTLSVPLPVSHLKISPLWLSHSHDRSVSLSRSLRHSLTCCRPAQTNGGCFPFLVFSPAQPPLKALRMKPKSLFSCQKTKISQNTSTSLHLNFKQSQTKFVVYKGKIVMHSHFLIIKIYISIEHTYKEKEDT
jgi:hypothetical protein